MQWLRIANARLRYHMHIQDPDSLTDEEFAARLMDLKYIREQEKKNSGQNKP